SLTAPEERARATSYAVDRAGRDRRARRVQDLTQRHAFAVADDAAVVGVRGDALGRLVRAREHLAEVRHAHAIPRLARYEREPGIAQAVDHVLGDAHRGGETGRPDAAHAHVALARVEADLVVAVLGRSPEAHVHRGHLLPGEAGQDAIALLHETRKPGGRGARRRTIADVLRRGTDDDVAEHGRADQHALRPGRRDGQDDVVHQRAGELV